MSYTGENSNFFERLLCQISIPEIIRSFATTGVRLFFRTLKTFLQDDNIVYFEPDIQRRRPDFVIIGPDLGESEFTQYLDNINQERKQIKPGIERVNYIK